MAQSIFKIKTACPHTKARTGTLFLRQEAIPTPIFMPVGTRGAVKAMRPAEVASIGYRLILGNTFHLGLRPGSELIERLGKLHRFMNWPHAILTDSGGFQVYSLAELRKITEEGVQFRSPYDGAWINLTPERSIQIQHQLGSDIVMAFDECLGYDVDPKRAQPSTERTLRWLERCAKAHQPASETQHLFGIAQGWMDPQLRAFSASRTAQVDLPGYAIGGLSVGEPEAMMMEMLEVSIAHLPEDRPRYTMGIGLPMNLIDMVMRGVDMFDCVTPTRNARNGRLYTFEGTKSIKHSTHLDDASPIEKDCPCAACRHYSCAYLRHLYMSKEILCSQLLTEHNLTFFWRLMERIRGAIESGTLPQLRAQLASVYEAQSNEFHT